MIYNKKAAGRYLEKKGGTIEESRSFSLPTKYDCGFISQQPFIGHIVCRKSRSGHWQTVRRFPHLLQSDGLAL
jgi:hypothetical protein